MAGPDRPELGLIADQNEDAGPGIVDMIEQAPELRTGLQSALVNDADSLPLERGLALPLCRTIKEAPHSPQSR